MAVMAWVDKPPGFPVPLWVSLGMGTGIALQVIASKGVFYAAQKMGTGEK